MTSQKNPPPLEKRIRYTTEDGEDLALCTYAYFEDVGYISWIWVTEPLRGNGVGTDVVKLAIENMKGVGINEIYVLPKSGSAEQIFIEKLGFYEASEVSAFVKEI